MCKGAVMRVDKIVTPQKKKEEDNDVKHARTLVMWKSIEVVDLTQFVLYT